MNINTYGLVDEETKAIEVVERIWNKLGLNTYFSKKTKEDVFEVASTSNFKPVDKLLEPFIGVYDFEKLILPDWYKEFKEQWVSFVSANLKDEIVDDYMGNKELKETQKLVKAVEMLNKMTPKMLKEGKLPNNTKIVKALKGIIEQCCNVDDPLNSDWYRTYELNQTTSKDESIVITNSIPSILGMSSYFDNPKYSSCMTVFKENNGTSYGLGLWGNIIDTNSLMLYVTKNSTQKYRGLDEYEHQTITVRAMLRLVTVEDVLKCPRCGVLHYEGEKKCKLCFSDMSNKAVDKQEKKVGVVIDRIYPHGQYNYEIFKLVETLCKENGLDFFLHTNYNSVQDGGSLGVDLNLDTKSLTATNKNPVNYLLKPDHDKDCGKCQSMRENKLCSTCVPASSEICGVCPVKDNVTKICNECEKRTRCGRQCGNCDLMPCKSVKDISRKVYDDNAGGSNFRNEDYFGNYQYKTRYNVYLIKEVK